MQLFQFYNYKGNFGSEVMNQKGVFVMENDKLKGQFGDKKERDPEPKLVVV